MEAQIEEYLGLISETDLRAVTYASNSVLSPRECRRSMIDIGLAI